MGKGPCHHYEGGSCIICDDSTNSCCGEDKTCDDCDSEMCRDCFDKRNGTCPVCSLEIVTDNQLVSFLLQRCKLTREKAVKLYIKKKKKVERASTAARRVKETAC
jgi:hypothetical protein